jgi:hypothetical protein
LCKGRKYLNRKQYDRWMAGRPEAKAQALNPNLDL